jgi:hypothetical protein|uniref:Uncharacterized protein n=1 Tax=Myoviridae sp. ctqfO1 TaxID=2827710 RepID=A0A8S5T2V2_9CAUD|nr:MAG TPA: hypothetical protein [Myoviridae sp. ctqfO1]
MASYSDRGKGRFAGDYSYARGTLKDGVFCIWRHDGKKKDGITFTLEELSKAMLLSGNPNYALYRFIKVKDFESVDKWIENTKDELIREGRRRFWEEDIDFGKYSALEERVLDSMCRVIKKLYEMEYEHELC